jgi:hypothetical protein
MEDATLAIGSRPRATKKCVSQPSQEEEAEPKASIGAQSTKRSKL